MKKVASLLLMMCCVHHLGATPAQIVVVRHANKNLKVEEGALNREGRIRAAALGVLLAESPELLNFGTPSAIFAVHTDPVVYDTVRTLQTMTDLSRLTKTEIQTPYTLPETQKMGTLLLSDPQYNGKYVVVCWEHHNIPTLLKSLGVQEDVQEVKGDVFDRMWILQYGPDGTLKSYRDTSQRLLFGDSPQ